VTADELPSVVASRRRADLIGILQLLGSGIIAAVGLTVIASNRTRVVDAEVAIFILLFVQWETLGLLIAKTGMDQLIFATVSRQPHLWFSLGSLVRRRIVPIALLFGLVCSLFFSPFAGALMAASLTFDAYAVIAIAELNARREYRTSSVANLLNYPVFFGLLCILAQWGPVTERVALIAFVVSSAARSIWLAACRRRPEGALVIRPTAVNQVALQPVLNCFLFRIDQLALAVPGLATGLATVQPEFLQVYLFLAKFPELASGLLNMAGTVIMPRVMLPPTGKPPSRRDQLARHWIVLACAIPSCAVALLTYLRLWRDGGSVPWTLAIPFALHAILIFPVNLVSYSMVAQGHLATLLRNLLIAFGIGVLVIIGLVIGKQVSPLAWVVPAQLLVFLLVSGSLAWGRSSPLYAPQVAP
jgi:hypothetical protein